MSFPVDKLERVERELPIALDLTCADGELASR
jgi:hypothetical protein